MAGIANAKNRIAHRKVGDAFADGADHAGEIPTQDEWKLRLFMLADAHLPIGAVHAGRHHIDHHFARPGDRIRPIAVLQDIGAAILLNENRLHRVASAIRNGRRSATHRVVAE